MKEVLNFLKENPVQYLATIGLDDKPKVRPFQFMIEDEGKFYFCTDNQKPVYSELSKNLYTELCVCSPAFEWLRLSGKAVFINDLDIKTKIFEASPLVKNLYKSPENPIFEVFYLDEANAVITEISKMP